MKLSLRDGGPQEGTFGLGCGLKGLLPLLLERCKGGSGRPLIWGVGGWKGRFDEFSTGDTAALCTLEG